MVGKSLSHYKILEELGRGGMGVVYRAKDTKLDRIVALKFLPDALGRDDSSRERFMVEAKASARLTHANICTIHEVSEHEGQMFMVMECIEGITLKERLQDGAIPVEIAISYAVQSAKGLDRAHEAGITHRDIKPANIMVTDHDEIKILDFGLAKFAGGVDITKTGSTMGTAAYMSPEQMQGQEVGHRADIWALGAVLYEMLAGSRPFAGDYEAAVGYAILNENPAPLSTDFPDGLEDIVLRCLAKKADERYQSANDLLADLGPLLPALNITSSRPAAAVTRKTLNYPVIGFAALVLVALVWFTLGRSSTPDSTIDNNAVVVFPFSIQGDDALTSLHEGMVSLLSDRMDGVGSIRAIDANRVLARVETDPNTFFDPDESGVSASSMFADRFVLGSVVRAGTRTEILARVYDLEGSELGEAKTTFNLDGDLPASIDDLALQLIRLQLAGTSMESAELVTPTTTSFEALKYLIEAETAVREGRFTDGARLAELAISFDSTMGTAWYARARAYAMLTTFSTPYFREVEPYKDSLPPRLRRLYRLSDFYSGNAEERIRGFLRDYPDDVKGLGRLADLIYHSGPNRRPIKSASEAIPLFYQVLDLDPTNVEYTIHLYTQLIRDREIERANEVRDRFLSENPWTDELDAFIKHDSLRIAEVVQEIVQSGQMGDGIPWDLSWTFGAAFRWNDLDRLDDELNNGQSGIRRIRLHNIWAKLAVGKVDWAKQYLDQFEQQPFRRDVLRAHAALLPGSEADPEFLLDAESALMAWLDAPDSDRTDLAEELLIAEEDVDIVLWYISAQVRLKLRDTDGFEIRFRDIKGRADEEGPTSLAYHFLRRLDGFKYFQANEWESAAEALSEGLNYFIQKGIGRMILSFDAVARSTWAEALVSLERKEEAIATYRSINDGMDHIDAAWEGPKFLRVAQLYEELGDIDSAIDYYGRFVELWAEADPHLQPQVEDARSRLDELVLQSAGEPR